MALFIAGVLVGLLVEVLLYMVWWKPKNAKPKDVVVMTVTEAENCANERSTLKSSVLDKDREINHLHARVAMLEEAGDRTSQERASAQRVRTSEPRKEAIVAPTPVIKKEEVKQATPSVEAPAKTAKEKVEPKKAKPALAKKAAAPKKVAPAKKAAAKKSPPKKAPAKKKAAVKKVELVDKAAGLRQLGKLKGVGPKLAEILVDSGFDSIERVQNAKADDLKAVLEKAGGRYASLDASSWNEQAALIASGDNAGLKKLQASLK